MLILTNDFLNKAEQRLAEKTKLLLHGYEHDKLSLCLADYVELLAETILMVQSAKQEEAQSLMAYAIDYFELSDVPIGAFSKVYNMPVLGTTGGYTVPIPLAHVNQEELEEFVTRYLPPASDSLWILGGGGAIDEDFHPSARTT